MRMTPSKLELGLRCSYWARPEHRIPFQPPSAQADYGKRIHAVLAAAVSKQCTQNTLAVLFPWENIDAFTDMAPFKWLEYAMVPKGAMPEVGLAVDLESGAARSFTANGRNYRVAYTEVAGTADVVGVDEDGVGVVIDWKTGVQYLPPPGQSPQLLFYAAALARIHDLSEVSVRYVRVAEDPEMASATVDIFELNDFLGQVKELMQGIPRSAPNPGLHCQGLWCPLLQQCPVYAEASKAIAKVSATDKPIAIVEPTDIVSMDHAVWLYHRLVGAGKVIDAAWAALKSYSDMQPIEVEPGRFYGAKEVLMESVISEDRSNLEGALAPWLSTEEIGKLIEWELPKGKLEKAVKAKMARGEKEEGWDGVMRALRGAGCTKQSSRIQHALGSARKVRPVDDLPMHPKVVTPIGDGLDHRDPADPEAF